MIFVDAAMDDPLIDAHLTYLVGEMGQVLSQVTIFPLSCGQEGKSCSLGTCWWWLASSAQV
jgi:hypothetical protein